MKRELCILFALVCIRSFNSGSVRVSVRKVGSINLHRDRRRKAAHMRYSEIWLVKKGIRAVDKPPMARS